MLTPLLRACAQIDDPVFLGVLLRAVGWSLLCFIVLLAGGAWGLQALVALPYLRWLGAAAGLVGASLLALWLFLPVATIIATFYLDRVARTVEHRCYPALADPAGASPWALMWDGLSLGLRVLFLDLVALLLALLPAGVGCLAGWAIAGWALGRGLFMAVAMRRMSREAALTRYRGQRLVVFVQGGILVAVGWIPILNLLIPVLGTAAMVHVLHQQFPTRFVFDDSVVSRKRLM